MVHKNTHQCKIYCLYYKHPQETVLFHMLTKLLKYGQLPLSELKKYIDFSLFLSHPSTEIFKNEHYSIYVHLMYRHEAHCIEKCNLLRENQQLNSKKNRFHRAVP